MNDAPENNVRCSRCEAQVPLLPYCVRCGATLTDEEHPRRSRGYAASPNQRQLVPHVVSSIFPQLPRASMHAFRVALAFAAALVGTLAFAELYPIALIAAAIVVPLLMVLYLYDVSIYEDEPFLVIGLTAAWGATIGVGLGLLDRLFISSTVDLLTESTKEAVLEQGVLVPMLGLGLALGGPLALLVYPRFNDILDGTTFGAVSAVWLVSAQLPTQSASLFDDGLRPGGSQFGWTLRLLELAVVFPILWAAVVGAAAGSFWLRFRAPVRDQAALGVIGRPAPATLLAGAAVVFAASVHVLTGVEVALGLTIALTLAGLVWLRHAIHVGLIEEASEIDIGPPLACANCGASTPRHTFCGNCGIALRALPKDRVGGSKHNAPERRSA